MRKEEEHQIDRVDDSYEGLGSIVLMTIPLCSVGSMIWSTRNLLKKRSLKERIISNIKANLGMGVFLSGFSFS